MYSIDGLCPSGHPLGGYGFAIHLSPAFRDAVKASGHTQEHVDRAVKVFGTEWLMKCGFSHYFDPENCGHLSDKYAIPSERTKPSYAGNGLRVRWGEWGIEHISVPGNACGLDIERTLGNPFRGGRTLSPHNVDSWSQVCLLLVTFTWFAQAVLISASVADSKSPEATR